MKIWVYIGVCQNIVPLAPPKNPKRQKPEPNHVDRTILFLFFSLFLFASRFSGISWVYKTREFLRSTKAGETRGSPPAPVQLNGSMLWRLLLALLVNLKARAKSLTTLLKTEFSCFFFPFDAWGWSRTDCQIMYLRQCSRLFFWVVWGIRGCFLILRVGQSYGSFRMVMGHGRIQRAPRYGENVQASYYRWVFLIPK